MSEEKCGAGASPAMQKILVFQQKGSAEEKIKGIRRFGDGLFDLQVVSVDIPLPSVIDDGREYLPSEVDAEMVLDFLRHPDLSQDLGAMCSERKVPVVASGKKHRIGGVYTPPT